MTSRNGRIVFSVFPVLLAHATLLLGAGVHASCLGENVHSEGGADVLALVLDISGYCLLVLVSLLRLKNAGDETEESQRVQDERVEDSASSEEYDELCRMADDGCPNCLDILPPTAE